MAATTMLYGKIVKGKVITMPKPKWPPLKGDTFDGRGELPKSALGGRRRVR